MKRRTLAAAALRERAQAIAVDDFIAEFGEVAIVLEPDPRDLDPEATFLARPTAVDASLDNDVERVLLMLRTFVKLDVAFVRRAPPGIELLVGRNRDAALLLVDASVSKRHALLHWEGDGLVLRDAGSRHGTFVNGDAVGATPVRLTDGDAVRFGVCQVIVLSSRILHAQLRAWKERVRPAR
jgi:hypothetical protein